MPRNYVKKGYWPRPSDRFYWLIVSQDQYELPLAVFDTAYELAAFEGKRTTDIQSAVTHAEQGHYRSRYAKILKEEYGILE